MNIEIIPTNLEKKQFSETLFVCMSFENKRWKAYLEEYSLNYKEIIIFYNKEFQNIYLEEINSYSNIENIKLVDTSISDSIYTADKYVENITEFKNKTIDIDCSTFTHEHLLIFLKVVNVISETVKINIIYTSVNNYLIGNDLGWLSKGVKDIRNILGYSGNFLPSKPLHLIILVGLENERIQKIIEEYEPNKITIGKCTQESSLSDEIQELNKLHHERVDEFIKSVLFNLDDSSAFEFSCDTPEESYKKLNEIVEHNNEYNNVIVAANSKISTLGVAKLGLLNEDIQICYAQPIEYNISSYTDGCKDFKFYEIIVS